MATDVRSRFGRYEERDLPEPVPLRRILGPSVILVGVGIASGEYVLWPAIASQVGLVFLWAAVVGVLTQYFLNMEIERYTLATGETAISGFQRMWRGWGIVMVLCAILPNMWPGWATSASTLLTFLTGWSEDSVNLIAIIALLVIGVTLTASPVIYNTVEKIEFVKVGLVVVFLLVALTAALGPSDYEELGALATDFGTVPGDLELATLLGALAFAGAGGTNNLVQSNWIRDKGLGMGAYVPRLVSPITGKEEAAPEATAYTFPTDEANMERWRRWWRTANLEQFLVFFCIGAFTIVIFSLLAYSTVFGRDEYEVAGGNFDFIRDQGEVLKGEVGSWFGTLFWLIGCLGLFGAALGIVDYVSRLVADVLKVGFLPDASESRMYLTVAWGLIAFGIGMLLIGFDQPLTLLVLSASLSAVVMFIYSGLLARLNRRYLPEPIRVRGLRLGVLVAAFLFFGVFSIITVIAQFGELF
jgi:hypothetical protein